PANAAEGSAATVLAAPDATADATDSRSDVLALLGIAGLHAVQSPQSRARSRRTTGRDSAYSGKDFETCA
ncbi:MAG: hypothetical protein WC540_08570, partial [Sulfuritalea sp.]